jgi:putative PEP-CTERM system TPR-repeat lipoprotein
MRLVRNLVLICVPIFFISCSDLSGNEYLSSAKNSLQEQDTSSAIIDLKNAIRVEPNNSDARQLLATTYESIGDFANAQKEFEKTIELDPLKLESVSISYAKVLYMMKEYDTLHKFVLEQQKSKPEIYSALLIYDALANYDEGKSDAAADLIDNAIGIVGDSNYVKLGLAMQASKGNDYENALIISSDLIKIAENIPDVWILHGQLLLMTGDFQEAEKAFKKFVELQPKFKPAKIYYAYALLKNNKYSEVERITSELLKEFPSQPLLNQMYGFSRLYNKDYQEALLYIGIAIDSGIRSKSNLLAAGLAAFHLGKYESAYRYLEPIRKDIIDDRQMKRVLSFVDIKLGYDSEVLESFQGVEQPTEFELDLISTAGFNLIEGGDRTKIQAAIDVLDSVDNLSPDLLKKRGLLKVSMSNDEGIQDIEQSLSKSESDLLTDKLLAASFLRNGSLDKLVSLAKGMQNKYPNKAIGFNLEALKFLRSNDIPQAKELYLKALSREPNNIEANLFFAQTYYLEKEFNPVVTHLNNILNGNPKYIPALSMMFKVKTSQESRVEYAEFISKIAKKNSDDMELQLLTARILLSVEDYEASSVFLQKLEGSSLSYSEGYWLLKIAINAFLENKQSASDIFNRWIQTSKSNSIPWILKIEYLESTRKYAEALEVLNDAKKVFPDEKVLSLIEVQLLLVTNNVSMAKSFFGNLPKKIQESNYGIGLKGQFSLVDGQFQKSQKTLLTAYKVKPRSRLATAIFQTYFELDKPALGLEFLDKHVESYPFDEVNRMILAESYIKANPEKATSLYMKAFILNNKNIVAANNVAYLSYESGKLDVADEYVNRALLIDPSDINTLDTAAAIKTASGEIQAAVDLLMHLYTLSGDAQYKVKAQELEKNNFGG